MSSTTTYAIKTRKKAPSDAVGGVSHPGLNEDVRKVFKGAPRRKTAVTESELFPPPPKRRYSKLAEEQIKTEELELHRKLKIAEQSVLPLCARTRADLSDSHPHGPWKGKVILSLGRFSSMKSISRSTSVDHSIDGGGIKGYSSLLILKRLTALIEELERGKRRCSKVSKNAGF
jgi:hypothetical protein